MENSKLCGIILWELIKMKMRWEMKKSDLEKGWQLRLNLGSVFQMYSEGSDIVPQSNETALHYFKKAADMVRLPTQCVVYCVTSV